MARTIGYSRFRDSKPSYLLRAYSGDTYSNFSLCTGRSRFVTHYPPRLFVFGKQPAKERVATNPVPPTTTPPSCPWTVSSPISTPRAPTLDTHSNPPALT